ncbi:hypothetical protein CHRY9390_02440 [Chryseobacterium aquaeductus]|uniref:Uncharacterized protein n=1 Tax=Chryseobacterium aquaeductus TaxID=2675056 RepID=A0A9N8MH81_9FLAO|nr:hypothetical protein CHRY9390_02440 [Chryseobacterium potabilaquae]CAD7811944.1 hypothetical protein CHRY9390_02440 [Chryseobacterium aquaeductus]
MSIELLYLMKISNKNTIKYILAIHITVIIAFIFTTAVISFLFPTIFEKIQIINYSILIYCFVKIFRLKYVEYENSGEVISLKRYSIFHFQKKQNRIELPLYKINNMYIKKDFCYNYLIINFRREDQKFMKIHFSIDHIKKSDHELIINDFKNYITTKF